MKAILGDLSDLFFCLKVCPWGGMSGACGWGWPAPGLTRPRWGPASGPGTSSPASTADSCSTSSPRRCPGSSRPRDRWVFILREGAVIDNDELSVFRLCIWMLRGTLARGCFTAMACISTASTSFLRTIGKQSHWFKNRNSYNIVPFFVFWIFIISRYLSSCLFCSLSGTCICMYMVKKRQRP